MTTRSDDAALAALLDEQHPADAGDAVEENRPMTITSIDLDPNAHALRPVRALKDDQRMYTATTFADPRVGCYQYLNRCRAFGYLKDDGTGLAIDVLDKDGDIVQDYPITRKGFEYLRRCLKFKVERDEDE